MNDFEYAIFFDVTVLIDYCRTHLNRCDSARTVIHAVRADGGRIDVSKSAWSQLNNSVSNRQKLFKYLRDRATEHLRDHDIEVAEEKFKANVLSYTVLSSEAALPFNLNEKHRPDVKNLHDCIDEMGLEGFRAYLDTHLTQFSRAHSKLDRLIDKKYHRGGRTSMMAEIVIEDFADSKAQYEGLVDAYFWGDTHGSTVVIRASEPVYENREEFEDRIWRTPSAKRFKLVSPEDVIKKSGLT